MDQRQRRIAIVIKHLILQSDQHTVWDNLATLTGSKDIIFNHDRLLRSLHFGDEDYEHCVTEVIESLIDQRPDNLDIMLDYLDLPEWLKENDPTEYAKLFGHSQLLIDELSNLTISNRFYLNQHILRIRGVIDSDPELAIGSTKELLESTMKSILLEREETFTGKEDFSTLLRLTKKSLQLDPSQVNIDAKGSNLIKRTLSNLGQLVTGINELRNDYGTGHGQPRPSGVKPRHARLAVNAGAALAVFLIETYEHRETLGN